MISYRSFRNGDPPALADIWRCQLVSRGLAQPMSAQWLESFVFSKPYFDPAGLIVAVDDGRAIGFAHAAFGASDDGSRYVTQLGVVCMVMVRTGSSSAEVAGTLLSRAEEYLRGHGTQVLYGGGIRPLNGFYLGLYGGSELPGVLDSDVALRELFLAHRYREIDRTLVYHRGLLDFRAPVDRRQMQLRRRMTVQAIIDPPTDTWWEACTVGCVDRTRFDLIAREGGPALGSATFWDMQPLASTWGTNAAGLIDVRVAPEHRRQGMCTFLLSESFRQLHDANVKLVEAQTMQRNTAATGMYQKLGFQLVDQASVYRKEEQ